MHAQFEVAVGRGHAGASLALDRSHLKRTAVSWWLMAAAAVLTIPFTLALMGSGFAQATHSTFSLPQWLVGNGHPGWGRVIVFGPPLALLLLVAARVRVHGSRTGGRWTAAISADLSKLEIAIAVVALAVAGIFFGHLVADSWACANGVRSAC